ncbi:MAG: acyl carrier protein [Oscillospiraceae bacterium]|nr:acyl carrier protein [Oscillospiraceae bacterium]MDO5137572.1 acyl carrier protein [Oscillospiraceae bacterium]
MVYDSVVETLCDKLGLEASDIDLSSSLVDDLEADSISMLEIVMELEDVFDIDIPDEVAEDLRTVSDLVAYIESQL